MVSHDIDAFYSASFCYWIFRFFLPSFLSLSLSFLELVTYFCYVLAVLGLCCCMQAFSSSGEWGLLFSVVCKLLTVVAFLVAEHRL